MYVREYQCVSACMFVSRGVFLYIRVLVRTCEFVRVSEIVSASFCMFTLMFVCCSNLEMKDSSMLYYRDKKTD